MCNRACNVNPKEIAAEEIAVAAAVAMAAAVARKMAVLAARAAIEEAQIAKMIVAEIAAGAISQEELEERTLQALNLFVYREATQPLPPL